MRVVGVDGYRKGRVAVAVREGRFDEAQLLGEFAALLAAFPDAQKIGVDIPIGLPAGLGRRADVEAREPPGEGPIWR